MKLNFGINNTSNCDNVVSRKFDCFFSIMRFAVIIILHRANFSADVMRIINKNSSLKRPS